VASESFWASRVRWRLRGAWMWPTFAVLVIADAVILHELPPISTGIDAIPALILSSFTNLFIVGALAPWLVWFAERKAQRPSTAPREVRVDRTATALLCVGLVGIVAAGLAARPAVILETERVETAVAAAGDYVDAHAPPDVRRNWDAGRARIDQIGTSGLFRACAQYADLSKNYCVFVDTNEDPPTVRKDPSTLNNPDFLRGRDLP
jgi:hypothetical protein